MGPLLRAVRPTHWVKNLWIGAPLVFAGKLLLWPAASRSLALFACFCALASAVYLANDLADLALDRAHPFKRSRPLAAGELSIPAAVAAALVLSLTALAGATLLSHRLPTTGETLLLGLSPVEWMLAYVVNNVVYMGALKARAVLDVLSIAAGFVIRLGAGSAVLGLRPSSWLLLCGFCLALLLALGKRRLELHGTGEPSAARPALSGYATGPVDRALTLTAAVCVGTYLFYTLSEHTVTRVGSAALVSGVPLVAIALLRFVGLVREPPRAELVPLLLGDRRLLGCALLWATLSVGIVYA